MYSFKYIFLSFKLIFLEFPKLKFSSDFFSTVNTSNQVLDLKHVRYSTTTQIQFGSKEQ